MRHKISSRVIAPIAGLMVWAANPSQAAEPGCTKPLLTVEADGTVSAGSKAALHDAVMAGTAIRVGWGLDTGQGRIDLIHWADAAFITLWEGEIFTQVAPIHRQAPIRGKADVTLTKVTDHWTGLLSSRGTLNGHMNTETEPTTRPVKVWWCAAR